MSKIFTKKGKIIVTNYAIFLVTSVTTATITTYYNKIVLTDKTEKVEKLLKSERKYQIADNIVTKKNDYKGIYSPIVYLSEDIKNAIYRYESDFNSTAVSKSGKYVGICQMGNAALIDVNYTKGINGFKKEPIYVQKNLCTDRFEHLLDVLEKNNLVPNLFNLYILHQQGEGTGVKLLKGKKLTKYEIHRVADNISKKELLKLYKDYTYKQLAKGIK